MGLETLAFLLVALLGGFGYATHDAHVHHVEAMARAGYCQDVRDGKRVWTACRSSAATCQPPSASAADVKAGTHAFGLATSKGVLKFDPYAAVVSSWTYRGGESIPTTNSK